ncbi:MAG: hypothetical protein ABIG86_01150 [Patescibacteria group bacterium]
MNVELEKRFLIDSNTKTTLEKFLSTKGEFKRVDKRFSLIYYKNEDLGEEENETIDLRVKVTSGACKVSLKVGSWHADAIRKEYEFNFEMEDLENVLNVLKVAGFKWGAINYLTRKVYEYNALEICIDAHYTFDKILVEMEALNSDPDTVKKFEYAVKSISKRYNLNELKSEEMKEFVNRLNGRLDWKFNFQDTQIEKWLCEWKDHISCLK